METALPKANVESKDKTAAQGELLFNRITKRYRHLKKWAKRTGSGAFRLYDRDIPEIPLVLDFYNGAVSGALYKRQQRNDENDELCETEETGNSLYTENWLLAMKASIARALDISEDTIFLKERMRMRNRQERGVQYGKISGKNFYRDIHEGDLCFRVNLSDYLDTGLFLDARKKRAVVRNEAAGKRVLNLFAYTCSLSVAAAKGGALQVDSVDLSNTYLEWGKINFALNGFSPLITDGKDYGRINKSEKYLLIRADALVFLRHAVKAGIKWDQIILDPPAFSNSKKMTGTLDTRRDHRELIQSCLSLLGAGGKLWFSSGAKGFDLNAADYPLFTMKDMRTQLLDDDFRGKRMPLCYTFTETTRGSK